MTLFNDDDDDLEVPGIQKEEKSKLFGGEAGIPFEEDDQDSSFGPLGESEPVDGGVAGAKASVFDDDDFEEEEIVAEPRRREVAPTRPRVAAAPPPRDRKSTRLKSSHY